MGDLTVRRGAAGRGAAEAAPSGTGDGGDAMATDLDHGADGEQHEGRRHHEPRAGSPWSSSQPKASGVSEEPRSSPE